MTDVLTLGETMAAFRMAGPLRLGGPAHLSVAGSESTVAIGLARLGHRASWLGVTGADEPGELVRRSLRAEGVDIGLARVDPHAPTGLILFEPRVGDLTRVTYHRTGSAGSRLNAEDVHPAFAADRMPRILHVTGITCALGDGPYEAVRYAVGHARATGSLVCLDVNHRTRLWSAQQAAAALRPLLGSLDLVVASDDELAVLTDDTDPVAALLAAGVREVVVKHGAGGATSHGEHGTLHRPARSVPVVDTVGAGDAFVAGLLSGVLDGVDAAARLDRAVTVGAFAVATRGDWEGLPFRDDLALLDREPGSAVR
ncbi:sugar kinase [Catellatospora citrea]|uniref:Ribokinase n=1 Tax=Catellatospora citrea TaxID=53366 RepID=A0A8J3K5E2_9ACTN|nr:sugar kinase [Catellatospora citrea]RKE11300.1 2-dehydro-3-deoxygluconokinase [Catellatospora citrea]GIF96767.1 ribokinase [Catellatospora citrea]